LEFAHSSEFWLLYYGRPQNMELIFTEELFPSSLPPKERATHWIEFFSYFKPEHIKALNIIFSQKRR
jgi:sister chromatid cohesion protein PDS5